MALKNKYSESTGSFDKIQKLLATHGAKRVMFDYAKDGRITALAFVLEIVGNDYPFRMPARIENVEQVLYPNAYPHLSDSQKAQAYRTAWANIRDWLDAQMALIDTEMVRMEEIFMPYLIVRGEQTMFDVMQEKKFLLPDSTGGRGGDGGNGR